VPPSTVPIDGEFMAHLGQMGVNAQSIGFSSMDRSVHLDTAIERVIGRWKAVVREARGGGGMTGQRSLSGNFTSASAPPSLSLPPAGNNSASAMNNRNTNQTPTTNMTMDHQPPERTNSTATDNTMDGLGSDADADADADMEEDDSFVEMSDPPPAANFRLTNGTTNSGGGSGPQNGATRMGGMGEVVQGYVRIGA
jgi:hypothetical protein